MTKFRKHGFIGTGVTTKPPQFLIDAIPDPPQEPIKPELISTRKVSKEYKVGEEEITVSSLLKGIEDKDVTISAYEKYLSDENQQYICVSYIEKIETTEEDLKSYNEKLLNYNKTMKIYEEELALYNEKYKDIHNQIICFQIFKLNRRISQLKDELIE
jgi:hypothetical protein